MITLEQVLKAYEYANSHPHKYLRGTTNWCAAVAHSLNEQTPSTHHQGEPVAWQFYQDGKWWNGDDRIKDHRKNTENSGYKTRELYAEQPEPAADHTQCEECKGWGYHENHHEGGGTECGECGGSGNAPVALVMPGRLNTEGGYSLEAETWYNLALDDVASLNGVNK